MNMLDSPPHRIKIAAPCPANWEDMKGNDRVRFCAHCQLNVYDLSALSQQEAIEVVTKAEGRLCVRFYQRADGTIITDNCPVGIKRIKQRMGHAGKAILATAMSLLTMVESLWALPAATSQRNPVRKSASIKKQRKAKKRWVAIPTIGVMMLSSEPILTPPQPMPPALPEPLTAPPLFNSDPEPPPPKKQ